MEFETVRTQRSFMEDRNQGSGGRFLDNGGAFQAFPDAQLIALVDR